MTAFAEKKERVQLLGRRLGGALDLDEVFDTMRMLQQQTEALRA